MSTEPETRSALDIIGDMSEVELELLADAYPSASAGPHDNLADAVAARLAELRNVTI